MSKLNSLTVPIRGMHCKSCEILVEEHLKQLPGVQSVEVSLGFAKAYIACRGRTPSEDEIKKAVQTAGYDVGSKEKIPWISRDANDYGRLVFAGVILVVLYFIARSFGLFSLNIDSSSGSLGVVTLVGLVAGFSSCMALIGGLVLSISARHSELHPEATRMQKFRPHIFFNVGRILGFAVFGGLIGLIGSAFQLSASLLGILTAAVGLVMIFLGLKLIEIFPALKDKTLTLPKSISKLLGLKRETKEYSHKSALTAGALTFFLPCGFTQAMQLYAISTGSFTQGALIMGLFALGTAPGLLGVGGLSSVFRGQKARTFFMAAGLAVIALGVFNIANASRLISWRGVDSETTSAFTSPTAGENTNGEVQEIRMTQSAFGYDPSEFTIEAGKPVRWIITSKSQFSCASSIVVPAYKIRKALKSGENIIEFTPTAPGKVPFSCAMGMVRGSFNVVEGSGSTGKVNQTPVPAVQPTTATSKKKTSALNVLKTVYTNAQDIQPNEFTAKVGEPTSLEVDVKESNYGCMSTILIPGLYEDTQYLEAGNKLSLDFTPKKAGKYYITCAMGVPRGVINVK